MEEENIEIKMLQSLLKQAQQDVGIWKTINEEKDREIEKLKKEYETISKNYEHEMRILDKLTLDRKIECEETLKRIKKIEKLEKQCKEQQDLLARYDEKGQTLANLVNCKGTKLYELICKDFVPKEKIREKIAWYEKLEKEHKRNKDFTFMMNEIQADTLKEILK